MKMTPYLTFNGNCEAAFQFYAARLGGEIVEIHQYAGSPMADQVPATWGDKVMHASLQLQGQMLMGSDGPPDQPYEGMKGFSLALLIADPLEAERVYHILAENGTVIMPIAETFWALRFGMVIDQFGTPWSINCEAPQA